MRCKSWVVIFISLFCSHACATSQSLEEVSSNISGPVATVIYILLVVAFTISLGFAIATLFLWRRHRENPVHVPLSQVLFSLIIAVLSSVVPYFAAKVNGYDFFEERPSDFDPIVQLNTSSLAPPVKTYEPQQQDPSEIDESDESSENQADKKVPLWKE